MQRWVTRPWCPMDWIIRCKTRKSGQNTTTVSSSEMRPDTPHWNIRGGSSSRNRRPTDWIIQGQVAARRPGLDHSGQNTKERPQAEDCIIRGNVA